MSVRATAQRRFCPKCGAEPGHPCVGPSGPRIANHIERRLKKRRTPRKRGDAKGYVYFLQMAPAGPIKIGFTRRKIEERVSALRTGSPVPLDLLGAITGTQAIERELHRRFHDHRLEGEWFQPCDELMAVIDGVEG